MGGEQRKERTDGSTPERCARFLSALAECGHVLRSAMAAGKANAGVFYKLRRRDPEFAAQWDEAIATATEKIESGLIARAIAAIEAQAANDAAEQPIEPLRFEQVMQLLRHLRTADPATRTNRRRKRYATPEETDAALIARLDQLEARVRARQRREREARRAAAD